MKNWTLKNYTSTTNERRKVSENYIYNKRARERERKH